MKPLLAADLESWRSSKLELELERWLGLVWLGWALSGKR